MQLTYNRQTDRKNIHTIHNHLTQASCHTTTYHCKAYRTYFPNHHHHHNCFMALFPGPPGWASAGVSKTFLNLLLLLLLLIHTSNSSQRVINAYDIKCTLAEVDRTILGDCKNFHIKTNSHCAQRWTKSNLLQTPISCFTESQWFICGQLWHHYTVNRYTPWQELFR